MRGRIHGGKCSLGRWIETSKLQRGGNYSVEVLTTLITLGAKLHFAPKRLGSPLAKSAVQNVCPKQKLCQGWDDETRGSRHVHFAPKNISSTKEHMTSCYKVDKGWFSMLCPKQNVCQGWDDETRGSWNTWLEDWRPHTSTGICMCDIIISFRLGIERTRTQTFQCEKHVSSLILTSPYRPCIAKIYMR